RVEEGETVASISDAFGNRATRVKATQTGWVIASTVRPLVNLGEALVHIAAEAGPDIDEPAERQR
ncbi:MAG: succinylglutamate desuccinylase, partial [Actinobacteria bacterium]|nr:succinylglutamate desuccinylase [Actinomycetota bacterium]